MLNRPHTIACKLKFKSIKNPNNKKIINKIIASIKLTFFEAIGLDCVLLTNLSIFLSIMSLIMHPALLIKNEPNKKINNQYIKFSTSIF